MKEPTFALRSYYQAVMEKLDLKALKPIIKSLMKYGFSEDTILIFIEHCILMLSISPNISFTDNSFLKVRKYWSDVFKKIAKLSTVKNLSVTGTSEIEQVYFLINSKKIKGISIRKLEEIIKLEIILAEHRTTKVIRNTPIKLPDILYDGNRACFFESFADLDSTLSLR